MASLADLKELYFQECDELLEAMAEGLREMEAHSDGGEAIHSVFRAVHSIKGGAGAFDLTQLVEFAHRFETLLDHIRAGRLAPDPDLMGLLHRAGDHLSDHVNAAKGAIDPILESDPKILVAMDAALPADAEMATEVIPDFTPLTLSLDALTGPALPDTKNPPDAISDKNPALIQRIIRFTPHASLYRAGHDPALFMRALADLGQIDVTLTHAELPNLTDADIGSAGLSWDITLTSDASDQEISGIFEFVEDLADIAIRRVDDQSMATSETIQAPPEPTDAFPPKKLAEGQDAPPALSQKQPPQPAQGMGTANQSKTVATIRVNLDRVDRLINLIGELVIKEAMLEQTIDMAGLPQNSDIHKGLDGVRQLASEIQESVMAIRAQPLKSVFERMHRVIREASDATQKPVRLVTEGEETEVDKTIIEKLVDPLTHMLRNSIDHGLEPSAQRRAVGKDEEGEIRLTAAHRSGRIVIEVSDDGAGINREKVRKIAEGKNLISPDAQLSQTEIDNLLFLPGFSSKDEISALSGRGVGLDVVRREITSLGGRVTIQSTKGIGTSFTISLPLTLAVLQGMLVEVEGQTVVIPINAIVETIQPHTVKIHSTGTHTRVVQNRGDLVPLVDAGHSLNLRAPLQNITDRILIIVETDKFNRAALLVDRIHDTRQVVIKSLEENYGEIPGISAATILGNGRIALILDPDEIVHAAAAGPLPIALEA